MYEDSPEDLAHDLLSKTIFNGNSLGLPILGTINSLNQLSRDSILDYYKKYYRPDNTVISIAGNFHTERTIELIEKYFGHWTKTDIRANDYEKPILIQKLKNKNKDTEQLHFCLGMEGISQGKDDLYPLLVLNNIFGGSMSSRLFQKIREEKGLAYSIYSYPTSYKDTGIFTIYAGLNPSQILNVAELIVEDINIIKEQYLTNQEIAKSKEQLKGGYILGLESTSSRMTANGKSELLLGKIYSPEEIINKIDNVTYQEVKDITDKVFDKSKFNIAFVGKLDDEDKINAELKDIFFKEITIN